MFGHKWRKAALFGVGSQFGDDGKTWRNEHLVRDGGLDNRKYKLDGDPLQREDKNPNMEGWVAHLRKEQLERKFEETKKTLLGGGEDPQVKSGVGNEFGRLLVQKQLDAAEQELDERFLNGFTEWLRGAGTPQEYADGHMPGYEKKRPGVPLSDHPSVLRYLESHEERKANYQAKLTKMILNQGRMGPRGRPMTLDEAWKYYKYVVKNMPFDKDHNIFDDPNDKGPHPPHNATQKAEAEANKKVYNDNPPKSDEVATRPLVDDMRGRPFKSNEVNTAQTVPPPPKDDVDDLLKVLEDRKREREEIARKTAEYKSKKEAQKQKPLPARPPSPPPPPAAAVEVLVAKMDKVIDAFAAMAPPPEALPEVETKKPAKARKGGRIALAAPTVDHPRPLTPPRPSTPPRRLPPGSAIVPPPRVVSPTLQAGKVDFAPPRYDPDAPYPPDLSPQFDVAYRQVAPHYGPPQYYYGHYPQVFHAPSQPAIPSFAPPAEGAQPAPQPAVITPPPPVVPPAPVPTAPVPMPAAPTPAPSSQPPDLPKPVIAPRPAAAVSIEATPHAPERAPTPPQKRVDQMTPDEVARFRHETAEKEDAEWKAAPQSDIDHRFKQILDTGTGWSRAGLPYPFMTPEERRQMVRDRERMGNEGDMEPLEFAKKWTDEFLQKKGLEPWHPSDREFFGGLGRGKYDGPQTPLKEKKRVDPVPVPVSPPKHDVSPGFEDEMMKLMEDTNKEVKRQLEEQTPTPAKKQVMQHFDISREAGYSQEAIDRGKKARPASPPRVAIPLPPERSMHDIEMERRLRPSFTRESTEALRHIDRSMRAAPGYALPTAPPEKQLAHAQRRAEYHQQLEAKVRQEVGALVDAENAARKAKAQSAAELAEQRKMETHVSESRKKLEARQAKLEDLIKEDKEYTNRKLEELIAKQGKGLPRNIALRPTSGEGVGAKIPPNTPAPAPRSVSAPKRALSPPKAALTPAQIHSHTKKKQAESQPRDRMGRFVVEGH